MVDLDTEVAPEETSSRREAISAAFEAAEVPAPMEAAPAPVEAVDASPAPEPAEDKRTAAERARDEAGRFAKARGPKVTIKPSLTKPPEKAAEVKPTPAAAPKQGTPTATLPPAPGETSVALKAPASWKPAAREKWAALPPDVQQEAVRVDREVRQTMQESAEARKSWSQFQAVVAPYREMIHAEGGDALASAANLFQTAAQLRTAPAPQRAKLVADIVRAFGVDIGMLDQALAGQGQAPQQPQHQAQQQPFKDPRFDELMERIQSGQRQKTTQEVEDFGASHEFYEDVRQDMADQLELAARRKVALSLEDAYSRACKLHPEVSGVLEQREKAKAVNATQASTQRSRAAASSVKSKPAGPASTPAPSGRRGQLEAAMDSLSRG